MFLAAYEFDGDPAGLVPGYDRLMAAYPPGALDVHLCVVRVDGLTVYDTCPSRQEFEAFSASPEFGTAIAAAGLPAPRITPLGDVHDLRVRETARP